MRSVDLCCCSPLPNVVDCVAYVLGDKAVAVGQHFLLRFLHFVLTCFHDEALELASAHAWVDFDCFESNGERATCLSTYGGVSPSGV